MRAPMIIAILIFGLVSTALAEDSPPKITLKVPADWKGERIPLPPTFARDMKLTGTEEARFSPGMFQEKSDTFFSYLFVFQVEPKTELTQKVIKDELLTYYRGLSRTIFKSRNVKVDTDSFAVKIKQSKPKKPQKSVPAGLKQYDGSVTWIEPFVTQKRQTLTLEIQSWTDKKTGHGYLFVCASPKETTAEIWKTMRNIRGTFHREN